MIPSIQPRTYQDVKANLMWFMSGALTFILCLFYAVIISDVHRNALKTFFDRVPSSQVIGSGLIIGFCVFASYLMVFVFKVHDNVYDRYITKWRRAYDLDFILPKLVAPFESKLGANFFALARGNRYEFMKLLFYHFVADEEKKVQENLRVRFYEAATNYWLSQEVEIMLIAFFIALSIYHFCFNNALSSSHIYIYFDISIIILIIINRFFIEYCIKSVKIATTDEIEDIHKRFLGELEEQLKTVHGKFNIKYGYV